MSVRWTSEVERDGLVAFRVGRDGDRLVAEWSNVARFSCAHDGSAPEWLASEGADPRTIEKLRANAIPALVGHLRGAVTLHAAAVVIDGVAIACTGPSGTGKSTAVRRLVEDERCAFVSDDLVTIAPGPGVNVTPSAELCWVDDDGSRRPAEPARRATRPAPLVALVELRFHDAAPTLEALSGASALAVASSALVRFVVDEPAIHVRDLDRLTAIVQSLRVFRWSRPRNLAKLDEVVAMLDEVVEGARRDR